MKQMVRLRMRLSRDGNSFAYFIDYRDEYGNRKRVSLGHADRQKARRQQAQKERELRMGIVDPRSIRLSDFVTDSLARTGDRIRESTREPKLEWRYSSTSRCSIIRVDDTVRWTISVRRNTNDGMKQDNESL